MHKTDPAKPDSRHHIDAYRFWRFAARYAFRSLWRNRRRTVLTISTVALSVFVSLVADRYSAAIMRLWQEDATTTGLAEAQVHRKGYWEKTEGLQRSLLLDDASGISPLLKGDSAVQSTSRRLEFEGFFSTGSKSVYFLGMAVVPADELAVSPQLFTPSDLGQFLSPDDPGGVAIGRGLARILGLKVGDEAKIRAQTVDGSMNAVDVVIRGIVDIPHPVLSKRMIFINLPYAQEILGLEGNWSELGVRLVPHTNKDLWVDRNRSAVANLGMELRGWWEVDPLIRNVERIWDSVVGVIAGLLFISAGISVLNIIYMLVAERTMEIGTLMALGIRSRDVKALFAVEAAWIGLIGGTLGVVLANTAVLILGVIGVPFASPFGSGLILVRPEISWSVTATIFVAAFLICIVAAINPARRAASIQPVQAFRGQST